MAEVSQAFFDRHFRKTLEARLYTQTHSRTRRPDCPKNSVSVLLCSTALTGPSNMFTYVFGGQGGMIAYHPVLPVRDKIGHWSGEVLDNGEVTDGTHVTAGQLALALTPYAQVTDLAVNTAAAGNNAAAIQSLDDRVTAELASKLDSSALAPAIAPLATAAALATTDGQVAAHGSSIAALQRFDSSRDLGGC